MPIHNSLLIPTAVSESKRLFTTFNLGQPINVADYTTSSFKSISTVELNTEAYVVSSSINHTAVSSSAAMVGWGDTLTEPHHYIIPLNKGEHDIIEDGKPNSGITWPAQGGSWQVGSNEGTNHKILVRLSGNSAYGTSRYQMSYLEESQVIIADIDKALDIKNGPGDKGYIIIPGNLDPEIRDNLDYWLEQTGYKEIKVPKDKEDKVPPRNG